MNSAADVTFALKAFFAYIPWEFNLSAKTKEEKFELRAFHVKGFWKSLNFLLVQNLFSQIIYVYEWKLSGNRKNYNRCNIYDNLPLMKKSDDNFRL